MEQALVSGRVDARRALLESMLELSHAQLACLREGRESELMPLLERSESVRARFEELYGREPIPAAREGEAAALRALLEELLRVDRQCSALVQQKRAELKAQIKGLRCSGAQIQKYISPFSGAGGMYIDKRQ